MIKGKGSCCGILDFILFNEKKINKSSLSSDSFVKQSISVSAYLITACYSCRKEKSRFWIFVQFIVVSRERKQPCNSNISLKCLLVAASICPHLSGLSNTLHYGKKGIFWFSLTLVQLVPPLATMDCLFCFLLLTPCNHDSMIRNSLNMKLSFKQKSLEK